MDAHAAMASWSKRSPGSAVAAQRAGARLGMPVKSQGTLDKVLLEGWIRLQ